MGTRDVVVRSSDGKTVDVVKSEAEQSELNFNAKKTITSVDFLIQRIAYNSSGVPEYIGLSIPGTLDTDSLWLIKKNTISGFNITAVNFANGSLAFNQRWDQRTGLSYS